MTAHRPRRVAIITHVALLSGAELALLRLARNLDTGRYVPVVVTFEDGPLVDRLRSEGIETVVVPLAGSVAHARRGSLFSGSTLRQLGAGIAFIPRLARALRALDLDLVHTHSLKADLIGVAVRPLVRVPLVWHVHDRISADYLPARTATLVRVLARRVPRHVVVNSRATAETLLPLPRGWTVAYPGLDPTDFVERVDPPAGTHPVVGILGRIGPTKGQDIFLRAAAILHSSHPQLHFRIIGTPLFGEQDFEASLRDLSRRLGLDGVVDFTGFVSDPGGALRSLTAFVHASPVPEPFGQVIVEAMAAGVPSVVTDAGGASEIVRDGGQVLARLAAPGSVEELESGIRWIVEHPQAAKEMSDRALGSVRRRFTISNTAAAVMDAWDRVLRR